MLQVYAERFRHLKAPRKLKWRHSLGLVELNLTIGNAEPVDFRVTPAHAALLLQFSDDSPAGISAANAASTNAAVSASPSAASAAAAGAAGGGVVLSAGQLAVALGVPVPVVRRKAMFWVAAGVLLEQRAKGGEIAYSRATSIDPSRIGERGAVVLKVVCWLAKVRGECVAASTLRGSKAGSFLHVLDWGQQSHRRERKQGVEGGECCVGWRLVCCWSSMEKVARLHTAGPQASTQAG
jgi:hypothetical protein